MCFLLRTGTRRHFKSCRAKQLVAGASELARLCAATPHLFLACYCGDKRLQQRRQVQRSCQARRSCPGCASFGLSSCCSWVCCCGGIWVAVLCEAERAWAVGVSPPMETRKPCVCVCLLSAMQRAAVSNTSHQHPTCDVASSRKPDYMTI
jgi:hypothetical protein